MALAPDKQLHFAAGFFLAVFGAWLCEDLLWGFGLGVLAGVAKEVYDHVSKKGVVDVMDGVWTGIGAAAGTLAFWLILTYGTPAPIL